jgi:hypothetical protein
MSRRPPRRDVFRTTRTLRVLTVIVTLMFAAGLVFAFVSGRTVMIYAFLGLTVMGVLGIVETLVSRVELHDDHILTVALFVRRTHPRSQVTSVSWAKGSPVSIQLNGTTWANLPNTGHASTKITGAIRAWMNESP